ncbi:PREDICTED: DIS3-like exonuclease 2 isoform X1 [Prunus mume]|uniref:DIS3-like exonuclease 2 n=2 Tax=Prunus mume TaxID=102107 RepID=A0ABM0N596_PRUMU|nr:PREDICTED: DIS3-like exonuclease 2 isoform X1 [Prunus mume]
MKGAVVQAVVDRVEDGDKEKKKKQRRRRSKQNSSTSASNSANEIRSDVSECLGNGRTSDHVTIPLKQHQIVLHPPYEHGMNKASNFPFSSLPTMHINEQENPEDVQSLENQHSLPCDPGRRVFANSCPESVACGESPGIFIRKDFPPHHIEGYARRKYFTPYWSMEATNDAIEKGEAFKALFRVNAHNRHEAYCKVDGVPTDVLIGGLAEQNKAVEGDIVVVKVDPLPLWTRMKGSAGTCTSSAPVDDFNFQLENNVIAGYNCKGKAKVDEVYLYGNDRSSLLPERGSRPEESVGESFHSGPIGQSIYDHVAGRYPLPSDSIQAGSSPEQNEVRLSVERLCAMINSFPSKRPTGRVVAIVERSPRRDAIVGFLNVKQWISYREFCRKDMRKNKNSSFSNHEHIQMTPIDPRFPKMVVLVRNLPDSIKKRLENGDETIEMELFAARIDEWDEESSAPQAVILNAFGRGCELQPQIEAILFQNAINSSEFSPESLSCLPHLPWEVPQEEFQTRRDLRNWCIFTIDPSTATDLDDALSVDKLSNGIYRVGIHIADVSHFVLPGTPLDEEAQSRSTSVYMSRRKLPMLPPLLSENVGSLNPGVERLAFSIFVDMNHAGDVVDRWIGRTVIRSCCKLSYEHAQDIIDGKFNLESVDILGNGRPQLHGHFEWFDVLRSVKDLLEISRILKERRFSDGALQLESSKVVILFDEYGVPYDSMHSERKESNFLVEEFMLLANRTAAEVISRAFPDSALLRRHPEPNLRKLREFEAFCSKHGLELDTSSSGQFQLSLEKIREKLKDDCILFNILMNYATKPMQLAAYFCSGELKDKENDWGHYGLAVPLYTHFTSPLRRYPDIVVHRTLAAAIEAEELLLKHRRMLNNFNRGDECRMKCFTGIYFDKDAAESYESREVLSAASMKHRIPCSELLTDVAAYCNERKLASRHVKDACDKLYMWALLKKKEILLSEARIMGLGPRFMSIYIHKLAVERRIYYDEVEGLMVEWLDATSTVVLTLCSNRRSLRRGSPGKCRALEDVALVIRPYDLKAELGAVGNSTNEGAAAQDVGVATHSSNESEIDPLVFPLTLRVLSTISVVLHAIGGDDGPIDIGARLYMSSYLC